MKTFLKKILYEYVEEKYFEVEKKITKRGFFKFEIEDIIVEKTKKRLETDDELFIRVNKFAQNNKLEILQFETVYDHILHTERGGTYHNYKLKVNEIGYKFLFKKLE